MVKKKLMNIVDMVLALLVSLAVAGLFLNGTTLANPILGWIPAIVHTIVGWALVVIAGWKVVKKFIK